MKITRPDLVAYLVVVVCVIGIVVLSALHVPVPEFLTFAGTGALGIGGGVALQSATTSTPDPAPAAPVAATPQPLMSEPATGVFRAATHAP